jgi:hypothetical protein
VKTIRSIARIGSAEMIRDSSSRVSGCSSGCDTMSAGSPRSAGTEYTRSVALW